MIDQLHIPKPESAVAPEQAAPAAVATLDSNYHIKGIAAKGVPEGAELTEISTVDEPHIIETNNNGETEESKAQGNQVSQAEAREQVPKATVDNPTGTEVLSPERSNKRTDQGKSEENPENDGEKGDEADHQEVISRGLGNLAIDIDPQVQAEQHEDIAAEAADDSKAEGSIPFEETGEEHPTDSDGSHNNEPPKSPPPGDKPSDAEGENPDENEQPTAAEGREAEGNPGLPDITSTIEALTENDAPFSWMQLRVALEEQDIELSTTELRRAFKDAQDAMRLKHEERSDEPREWISFKYTDELEYTTAQYAFVPIPVARRVEAAESVPEPAPVPQQIPPENVPSVAPEIAQSPQLAPAPSELYAETGAESILEQPVAALFSDETKLSGMRQSHIVNALVAQRVGRRLAEIRVQAAINAGTLVPVKSQGRWQYRPVDAQQPEAQSEQAKTIAAPEETQVPIEDPIAAIRAGIIRNLTGPPEDRALTLGQLLRAVAPDMSKERFNPIVRRLAAKESGMLVIGTTTGGGGAGYKSPRIGLTNTIIEMIHEARREGSDIEAIQQMLIELAEE